MKAVLPLQKADVPVSCTAFIKSAHGWGSSEISQQRFGIPVFLQLVFSGRGEPVLHASPVSNRSPDPAVQERAGSMIQPARWVIRLPS